VQPAQTYVIWLSAKTYMIWLSAKTYMIWLSAKTYVIWLSAKTYMIWLSANCCDIRKSCIASLLHITDVCVQVCKYWHEQH